MSDTQTLAPPPIDFEEETIYVNGKYIQITVKGDTVSMREVPEPPQAWAVRPGLLIGLMVGGAIIWVIVIRWLMKVL